MLAEVILFWLTYVFMSFPQIIIYFMKKANLEDALREKDSDDEDDNVSGSESDKDLKEKD